MKKIIMVVLLSLTLAACNKSDSVYDEIVPKNEDITTAKEYMDLIDVAISMEYRYFTFLDLRSKSEYEVARIRHFKINLPFDINKESNKEELLKKVEQYKHNGYIVLISTSGDSVSRDAANYLNENGYNNVKVIRVGFEDFEIALTTEGYDPNRYIDRGDCGC